MPRKTKVEGEEVVVKTHTATIATISVNGQSVRAYSYEVHGENFEDLAREFAAQDPKRTVELA